MIMMNDLNEKLWIDLYNDMNNFLTSIQFSPFYTTELIYRLKTK